MLTKEMILCKNKRKRNAAVSIIDKKQPPFQSCASIAFTS